MHSFDVIVIGGGLVGASLALALKGADVSVALVEPQAPRALPGDESWDTRVYAVSPGNAEWLAGLGAWQRLPEVRIARVETMQIFGDQPLARLQFSAYDAGLRELAFIVENRLLQRALSSALEAADHATLYCPARCASIAWERDRAVIALTDGRELAARLVVGADGADSWVRERAGIAGRTHDYRQAGVVANFATQRPHDGTAFQWFRSDGVLALLPLPGERVSMVWSAPDAKARELIASSPDTLVRELERASEGILGALELITPAAAFPLKRQRVERLVEPRVALIGDAAHNVHPLAGQGVNLGFRDARELAAQLTQRGAFSDCGDYALLRRYERARKEDIAVLEATTDGLQKLFSSRAVWLTGLRNLGLTLVEAQPPLKNLLVRHAVA